MPDTDISAMETEVDNQIENLRRRVGAALQRRLSNPDCLSPAALIRILSPVIERYLAAGLVLEEVAKALQEEGFKVTKGHLVRHLGTIRDECGYPPLKRGKKAQPEEALNIAPPALGGGGGQGNVSAPVAPLPPAEVVAETAPSPAAVVTPAVPRPAPAPKPMPLPAHDPDGERPPRMTDEMWVMKPKIDKILKTFPTPDREYPELADFRYWTDSNGKKWDVRGDEKPDSETDRQQLDYASIRHGARWRALMEKWGLAQDVNGGLMRRYEIAKEYLQPLIVDLDEIIAKHLD